MGKCHLRDRGLWKSCGTLHVWWPYGNCWIHLGEYLVHTRLHYWILLHSWSQWHSVDQLVRNAQNEKLLWLAGMNCVEIWTQCKAKHLMAPDGETIYILEVELKIEASQTMKEWKCWVLTWLRGSYLGWKWCKVRTQAQ